MTRAIFGPPAPNLASVALATCAPRGQAERKRLPLWARKPASVSAPAPQRTAADFDRSLDAMVSKAGAAASLAARSYLDIAQACEARGLAARPSHWQRGRRRWLTMPRPWGLGGHPLKRCFAEGLRCGAEASLRYYGIDPKNVGLPSASDTLGQRPALICEKVVAALSRARLAMARLEMPHAHVRNAEQAPGCTTRAAFDSGSDELTVYIVWFNGPDERSAVHHCVPLLVASRDKRRHFTFPKNAVNALPKTCAARGYAPFRYTAAQVLEPISL